MALAHDLLNWLKREEWFSLFLKPEEHGASLPLERGEALSICKQALKELCISVLSKGAAFRFRARGFSMSPFIKDGDTVTAAPFQGGVPAIGDVVVFLLPDKEKLVIHRVVGKSGDSYRIRGDNVAESEDLVPEGNVLGQVNGVERDGKKVSFGLGPEKVLIGILAGSGLLLPLLRSLRRLASPIRRRGRNGL
jgi:hypothetical protein